MRVGQQEHAFRRHRLRIGIEGHPRQGDLLPDVVLRHDEIHRADPAAVLDDQVHHGGDRRGAAHGRNLRQGLAREVLEIGVLESDQQDILRAAGRQVPVLPGIRRRGDLPDQAFPGGGITKSLRPGLVAALLHPGRHGRVQAGGAGRVGVHVGGDVEALGARRLDPGDDRVELVPVLRAGRLEVVDLGADAGLAGDGDEFVHRFQESVALAAQVRDVASAVLRCDPAQRDQFIRVGVERRRVNQ